MERRIGSACIFISLILGLTTTKTQDTTFSKEQQTPTHLRHFTRTYQSPNDNNGFQQCWQQWEQASDCCANNEDALLARRDARNPTLSVIMRAVDSLRRTSKSTLIQLSHRSQFKARYKIATLLPLITRHLLHVLHPPVCWRPCRGSSFLKQARVGQNQRSILERFHLEFKLLRRKCGKRA